MAKLAFKPDSSFFRKIAIGAVGCRAVCADLARFGHEMVELERGSTDTKLWKDVKRKRVRIPDLVCRKCGFRVESRAKTKPDLSMSHSPADEARAWDFGMVDSDCIAFPICEPSDETYWSVGRLDGSHSYWHERNWVQWLPREHVNYIAVETFRTTTPVRSSTKGVTEGSETSIAWDATFSTRDGVVESVNANKVKIRRDSDGHRYTWTTRPSQHTCVSRDDSVRENQIIASAVKPLQNEQLWCPGRTPDGHIRQLLTSRERTQRFTGVKLARLAADPRVRDAVTQLAADPEEDVYIRLEAAAYLVAVCHNSATELFVPFLESIDEQTQLEAVIAIGEAATDEAAQLLCSILDSEDRPYFLRSAAAWSLGRTRSDFAIDRLIAAFADVDHDIREEALDGVVSLGGPAIPVLLEGIRNDDAAIAAGCAESLRQQDALPDDAVSQLGEQLLAEDPSPWTVWLLGHIPREQVATEIAELQRTAPHLHYAISVLWSFLESWIARRWELRPRVSHGKADGV